MSQPRSNPEILETAQPPSAIGRGDDAVVVGVSKNSSEEASPSPPKTTATTQQPDQYKTEFVKVYQDAGVIGVAMLTLLVLCLLLAWFSMRVLKMYIALAEGREKAEALRLEYFDKLTNAVVDVRSDIKQVLSDLRSDHNTHRNEVGNIATTVKSMSDRLDQFLFRRSSGGEE